MIYQHSGLRACILIPTLHFLNVCLQCSRLNRLFSKVLNDIIAPLELPSFLLFLSSFCQFLKLYLRLYAWFFVFWLPWWFVILYWVWQGWLYLTKIIKVAKVTDNLLIYLVLIAFLSVTTLSKKKLWKIIDEVKLIQVFLFLLMRWLYRLLLKLAV